MAEAENSIESRMSSSVSDLETLMKNLDLTQGQRQAVHELSRFLSDNDEDVFLLKGYAGTGKTFLIKGIADGLLRQKRRFHLAAPTGRAARVITEKTSHDAKTLHSLIYNFDDLEEHKVEGVDGSETFKLVAGLAVYDDPANTVFIVDEASLISDIYSDAEFFQSGSGFLLRDLLHFINFDHNRHNKKLILIGDDAQLPPVGMSFSPALDAEYLRKTYGVRCRLVELTDVVRQKSESGVLKNVQPLRGALKSGVFNKLSFDTSLPDVVEIPSDAVVPAFLESCGHEVNNKSVVITRSNAEAGELNRAIRERLFPGCFGVTAGDKLMVVKNTTIDGIRISNGDFVFVRSIAESPTVRHVTLRRKNQETGEVQEVRVELRFREADLGFRMIGGQVIFFMAQILENLLHEDRPTISSDEQKALYVDFSQRHPHLRKDRAAFRKALLDDPYFNALRVKFGYAMTCHKAQGSEWANAFVNCAASGNPLTSENFRWLYTALTRTSDRLYLINAPRLEIGSGIKVVGIFNGLPDSASPPSGLSQPTPVDSPTIDDASTFPSPLNTNQNAPLDIRSFIHERVTALIAETNIEIEDVEGSQYQEAFFFRKGDSQTRINICYNGRSRITRVFAPKIDPLAVEIEKCLAGMIGGVSEASRNSISVLSSTSLDTNQVCFSKPFLNDFHQKLITLTEKQGVNVSGVKEMQWCQRYLFTRGSEVAEIDIFYNGRSVFTRCQPVGHVPQPGPLMVEMIHLLTNGMQA